MQTTDVCVCVCVCVCVSTQMIALTTNIIKEGPELIRRLSTRMRSGR